MTMVRRANRGLRIGRDAGSQSTAGSGIVWRRNVRTSGEQEYTCGDPAQITSILCGKRSINIVRDKEIPGVNRAVPFTPGSLYRLIVARLEYQSTKPLRTHFQRTGASSQPSKPLSAERHNRQECHRSHWPIARHDRQRAGKSGELVHLALVTPVQARPEVVRACRCG